MSEAAFDDLDMAAARAKFMAKVDGRKAARKSRQKKTADAVDGRSLRATGRTEHLNFKATPKIKAALARHIPKGKTSLWLEEAIIEKFSREGIDLDA
jgi:hypothetical protein